MLRPPLFRPSCHPARFAHWNHASYSGRRCARRDALLSLFLIVFLLFFFLLFSSPLFLQLVVVNAIRYSLVSLDIDVSVRYRGACRADPRGILQRSVRVCLSGVLAAKRSHSPSLVSRNSFPTHLRNSNDWTTLRLRAHVCSETRGYSEITTYSLRKSPPAIGSGIAKATESLNADVRAHVRLALA